MKFSGVMALELTQIKKINIVCSITQIVFIVRGNNILPKFVNQLIASSIQIVQIDSRHLLSYYICICQFHLCTTIQAFFVTWTLLFGFLSYYFNIINLMKCISILLIYCLNSIYSKITTKSEIIADVVICLCCQICFPLFTTRFKYQFVEVIEKE